MGLPYRIGAPGEVNFFYKLGNPDIAQGLDGIVFDVVNDNFEYQSVREMCQLACMLTAGSEVMAETVRRRTGRAAVVIDDPYENDEAPAGVIGDRVVWFGHAVNLPSLSRLASKLKGFRMTVCTNFDHPAFVQWSPQAEKSFIDAAAVVVVSGTNPGASSNRVVKTLRAGRFPVMPKDCAESWRQFGEFAWIGDVREGVAWALNNRDEACKKILAGQHYIRERFSPQSIGSQWTALFGSILGQDISIAKAGSG